MTWVNISCKNNCGETISVGHYGLGDYEDEYADYEIIATCGECNRAEQGIPSKYEEERTYEESMTDFKTRVMNEGIDNVIDYRIVYEGNLNDVVQFTVSLWKEQSHPRYLEAIWGLLKTLPSNGLMVVAE